MKVRTIGAWGVVVSGALLTFAAEANEPAPPARVEAEADAVNELGGDPAEAEEAASEEAQKKAAFEASLNPQQGEIDLKNGLARLTLPESYRYLAPPDADRLLQAWGNPPSPDTLGIIYPIATKLLEEESWAVVIGYVEDGHVDDEDAKEIDFGELLAEMKQDTEANNEERTKLGYERITLIGWAEPPRYDESAKKLYWAKELAFGNAPERTLNYAVRVLGRQGVLELNAVASMQQLPAIRRDMAGVIGFTEFKDGNRYADFNPKLDKVAAYGIGGLIAGKLAAKAGLVKVLVTALLASKKLIVAAVVGLGLGIKALLSRGKGGGGGSDAA